MDKADRIIAALGLAPHPEGGWYRQTWIGPGVAGRATGTAIHFLLKAGERSHWHRVDADEIWHHYAGAPLILSVSETETGPRRDNRLGADVLSGEQPQITVPAHHWQAAVGTGDWTLVGCTVSPGFRFDGFRLAPPGFDIPAMPDSPDEVLRRHFPGAEARYFSPLAIGATTTSKDEGAALILAGIKTATSALPAEFGDGPPPFPGALSVLLDGADRPRAVVETLRTATVAFGAVDADMARAYGEGDRTLAGWRDGIGRYYRAAAAARGQDFGDDAPLLFEWFRVVMKL